MGLFGALTTAVTGLRAQSFALENVSGNIANSQTIGFKRVDTSFQDLIPDDIPSRQKAGNVMASSRATNTVQGDVQNAAVGTFMAVNGDGFFVVVAKPSSLVDGRPVFSGTNLYTRRGDFQPDKNGYLVNGAGYYLLGINVDQDDRQSRGKRAAAPALSERLFAGATDDAARLSRQPRAVSADPAGTTPACRDRNSSTRSASPPIRRRSHRRQRVSSAAAARCWATLSRRPTGTTNLPTAGAGPHQRRFLHDQRGHDHYACCGRS